MATHAPVLAGPVLLCEVACHNAELHLLSQWLHSESSSIFYIISKTLEECQYCCCVILLKFGLQRPQWKIDWHCWQWQWQSILPLLQYTTTTTCMHSPKFCQCNLIDWWHDDVNHLPGKLATAPNLTVMEWHHYTGHACHTLLQAI